MNAPATGPGGTRPPRAVPALEAGCPGRAWRDVPPEHALAWIDRVLDAVVPAGHALTRDGRARARRRLLAALTADPDAFVSTGVPEAPALRVRRDAIDLVDAGAVPILTRRVPAARPVGGAIGVAAALCGVAVLASGAAGPAAADRHVGASALYLGLGGGVSRLEPESDDAGLVVEDGDSAGGRALLGIELGPRLSLEAHYQDLGEARLSLDGRPAGAIDYAVYGVDALGWFGRGRDEAGGFGTLRPFLSLGLGAMSNDSDVAYEREHDVYLAVGAGLEAELGAGFALRGQLQGFDTDARAASLTLTKRFGQGVRPAPAAPAAKAAPQPVVEPAGTPIATGEALDDGEREAVRFGFDRFDLDDAALSTLERLFTLLDAARSTSSALVIEGHTDASGPDAYNIALSVRRASAVRDWLASRGIDRQRMTVVGYGERRPAATNATREGRSANRRVAILATDDAPA